MLVVRQNNSGALLLHYYTINGDIQETFTLKLIQDNDNDHNNGDTESNNSDNKNANYDNIISSSHRHNNTLKLK